MPIRRNLAHVDTSGSRQANTRQANTRQQCEHDRTLLSVRYVEYGGRVDILLHNSFSFLFPNIQKDEANVIVEPPRSCDFLCGVDAVVCEKIKSMCEKSKARNSAPAGHRKREEETAVRLSNPERHYSKYSTSTGVMTNIYPGGIRTWFLEGYCLSMTAGYNRFPIWHVEAT